LAFCYLKVIEQVMLLAEGRGVRGFAPAFGDVV